jgi:hypothetical protein
MPPRKIKEMEEWAKMAEQVRHVTCTWIGDMGEAVRIGDMGEAVCNEAVIITISRRQRGDTIQVIKYYAVWP